jgi:hypothetical protein
VLVEWQVRRQAGVISRAQAIEGGMSADAIDRPLRAVLLSAAFGAVTVIMSPGRWRIGGGGSPVPGEVGGSDRDDDRTLRSG